MDDMWFLTSLIYVCKLKDYKLFYNLKSEIGNIEVSGLIFIAFFLKGLTVNGKDAGCQLPYIFVVIIDGFNISISLIGMADIVAEPENTFVTGRGFDIILMCKVETKVIAERTVKRVQILIIPVYCDADHIFGVFDP